MELQVSLTKINFKEDSFFKKINKGWKKPSNDRIKDGQKDQLQIAAKAGCDLGLKWLERIEEKDEHLLSR